MKFIIQIRETIKATLKIAGDESVRHLIGLSLPVLLLFLSGLIPEIRHFLYTDVSLPLFWLLLLIFVGIALGAIVFYACLHKKLRRLELQAATDPFLDVFNSRECQKRLELSVKEALRYGAPFSICLIDLDGLKATNDRYGYGAGDQLLREFVVLTRKTFRETDVVFRYKQGDEFLVLITHTVGVNARVPAERLRQAVDKYRFQANKKGVSFAVTVSIGVVGFDSKDKNFNNVDSVKRKAEEALSLAKKNRNCVVCLPFRAN